GKRIHVQGPDTEADLINNPTLKALRRRMLAGEWDPMCDRCRTAEDAGGTSSRKGRNEHFQRHIPRLLADTASDGTVRAAAVRHLDMRLGNYCNLTCRMCSPGASKLWIDSYDQVQPEAYRLGRDKLVMLREIA